MARTVRVGVLACVLGAGLVACGAATPKPDATVGAYLHAWGTRDDSAMRALVTEAPAGFTATNEAVVTALHATSATYTAGVATRTGDQATAPVTGHLTVPGWGTVETHGTITVHLGGGHWKVVWSPATVATGLADGDHVSEVVAWPARAPVLGAGGAVLTPSTQTVTVGVTGSRLKDPTRVAAALTAAGFPAATVRSAIAAAQAQPGALQPVGTVSEDRYAQIAGQVYPLAGTSFAATDTQAILTTDLAAHTVGAVLPVTAEQLQALGPPYTATSTVGRGGLEAADERQLAGRPSLTADAVSPTGDVAATLVSVPAVAGRAVQTTIDPTVQRAAEAAMNGTTQTAAMVVIRPSTGEILASVSRPTASAFDLAFTGAVPPGSTFKVVTTTALLGVGVAPSATLTCPPTITVDGRTFHNDEGEATPTLSFAQAFAVSCNTAFIGAATSHLQGSQLVAAAGQFGLGSSFSGMGLPASSGSVPAPTDGAALAASAIGQGQTTVSPLAMAVVAATAATGTLRAPQLVTSSGVPAPAAAGTPLPAATLATLHAFMAGVVTGDGTAAGAGLPAGAYGKTGTAEYGTSPTPPTHAWFIGFRGDLAFAVYVDNGVGGTTAAPLAAALLRALPAGA